MALSKSGKGKSKGSPKTGGRIKGTPNKSTAMAKEAIANFVEGNVDRLVGWLDQIAEDDPKEAFRCFMSVVEYHIPKLQRTESQVDMRAQVDHHNMPALPQDAKAAIEGEVHERYGALPPPVH